MSGSGGAFFVESSDDDEQLNVPVTRRQTIPMGGPPRPVPRSATHPLSPQVFPQPGSPTIEDILFERPASPVATLGGAAQRERSAPSATPVPGGAHARPGASPVSLALLSGQAVNPLPRPVDAPRPQELGQLRMMTCSEVREQLEGFFARKEANSCRFKAVEAEQKEKREASTAVGVGEDIVAIRQRDRCARLVNVSKWGDGNDSDFDVLLPAALVSTSSHYTERGGIADPAAGQLTLRKHQIEGIRFMWSLLAEGPVGRVPAVGCILAHTMGLGKTAQVVIFTHLFFAANRTLLRGRGLRTMPRTLIVVPKSTISVWEREFATWSTVFPPEMRLTPTTLEDRSYSMLAAKRIKVFRQWRQHGGVLLIGYEALVRLMRLVEDDSMLNAGTGYPGGFRQPGDGAATARGTIVNRELQNAKRRDEGSTAYGGVDDPFTELLVCDEAHRLKSVNLQVVTALRGLHPLRRLLLTGTPLQNNLSDYWAMIDFAVHKYFDRYRFQGFFGTSIEASADRAASKQEVELARKKTFTLINEVRHFVQRVDSAPLKAELPPLNEYVVIVPLSLLQRTIYRRFVALIPRLYEAKGRSFRFLPAVSYAGKIASHPQLLFGMRDGKATGSTASPVSRQPMRNVPVPAATQKNKKNKKQRPPKKARRDRGGDSSSTSDSSSFSCSSSLSSSDSEDSLDDEAVARASTVSFSSLYENTSGDYDDLCEPPPGYKPKLEDGIKLHVAMNIIQAAVRKGEKTLLFSLSTRLLDFFERLIAQANATRNPATDPQPIRYCRLDGSHSGAQRADMLRQFNSDAAGLNLFLLSMKAGGVGITITAATRVILVDSSFNPADDQQAIGRAYRYGQTKPVFVYRLLCHLTLEYGIFEQKLAKDWLFKTVIEETSMKRDGLSGMHLRQIFAMLTSAAEKMVGEPRATERQNVATADLAAEDDVLASVRALILYAQRYQVFLSHDEDSAAYGEAEQKYYDTYRRQRMFDVGNDGAAAMLEEHVKLRRRARTQEAEHLQVQASGLEGMLNRLIRSRDVTEPHLAHLLNVMGIRADAHTGAVERVWHTPAAVAGGDGGGLPAGVTIHEEEEDSGLTVLPDNGEIRGTNGTATAIPIATAAVGRRIRRTNAEPDGDDEMMELFGRVREVQRAREPERARSPAQPCDSAATGSDTTGDPAHPRVRPVVDPSIYEPYCPGNSANNAIDIDSD